MDNLKKIAVVGLGIIGASVCRALTKTGYFVAGCDKDKKTLDFALSQGFIRETAENFEKYDVVFLAVPPRVAISFLQNTKFKDGALVSDVCGIKKSLEQAVYSRPRNFRYIGLHPMAGKETSGISASDENLFRGANLVVTLSPQTEQSAIDEVKAYAEAMGFKRITECSAEEHDKKIALTSQLAHLVSNAYVKSAEAIGCEGFTGGSFQDMTRIAGVDESMWSQLYLLNRENILQELDYLIEHLYVYKKYLEANDENGLKYALSEGRMCREAIKKEKK